MADAGLLEIVETTEKISLDDGDHDLFSHYISKKQMELAIIDGIPATALCGKTWLPTKDATRYPTCKQCEEAWESFPPGD